MFKSLRLHPVIPALLACGALLIGAAGLAQAGGPRASSAPAQAAYSTARAHAASPTTRAHAAAAYLTGIGDEQPEMFSNALWQQLGTRIVRYIAPYDAAVRPYSLRLAREWISAAEAQHQQVLVAFYHSEYTPTRMPSTRAYERDVKAFIGLFPGVHQYQPWNEANRGIVKEVRHRKARVLLVSPSPMQAALYYRALKHVCRHCTVVGLDLLDQPSVSPSLRYLGEFKRDIARLRAGMPSVWGLHNYSDTNRFQSTRTRAVLAAVPGQVWLTETGGIVKFGSDFPNRKGSGLARAARALSFMFRLASSNPRIKRLYIFQWSGAGEAVRFDAGLTDPHYRPRPGYVIVCERLHAARCRVRTSRH